MSKKGGYVKFYRWLPGELPNDGAPGVDIEARKRRGYFKVYRDILETDLAQNLALFNLFLWLLNIANWTTTKARFMGKYIEIKPGQIITGQRSLALELGCSTSTVYKHLKYLKDTKRIETQADTHGTLITICNWDKYQADDDKCETQADTLTEAPSEAWRETTIEEVQEVKNIYIAPELGNDPIILPLIGQCSKSLQRKWLEIYGDPDWIKAEIRKASIWMEANPKKKRSVPRFLSNWLNNALAKKPQQKLPFNYGSTYT